MGAASRGLWEADEHRLAEVAREMVKGGDWIVPHLEGAVYAHKPPLVPWIIAFCNDQLGMDLALAAKIPSILGAALAVTATFLIARRLYGTAAAVAAATALASAAEFAWICRRAQYDPLLAGFTTFALWFFVRSRFPWDDDPPRPWRDAILGGLCVGLGGMVKGPAALAFTVPVFVAFPAAAVDWSKLAARFREVPAESSGFAAAVSRVARAAATAVSAVAQQCRALATRHAAAAVVAVLVPAAVWLSVAAAREGGRYVYDLVVGHGVAHAAGDVDKQRSPFYYLLAFPEGLAPWTLFVPAAVAAATAWRREGERRADLFVLLACAVPFLVMSLIPAKRGLYLVPLLPASAVLVAKLAVTDEERLRSWLFAAPRCVFGALWLVAGTAVSAVALAAIFGWDDALASQFDWWTEARETLGTPLLMLAAAIGFLVALSGMRALRTKSPQDALGRLLGGALAGSILFAGVLLAAVDPLASPRDFYEHATAIVGDAPVIRYGVDDYAGHWAMKRDRIPFVGEAAAAAKFLEREKGPAFVVTERGVVEQKGMPAKAETVLEIRYPFGNDMLLLARGR